MNAKDGSVVFARVPGCPAVLGLVSGFESADGIRNPLFYVSDPDHKVCPMLFISPDYPGCAIYYEVTDQTLDEFFSTETRRHLAGFYKRLCEEKLGQQVNDLVTLNVVFWLEKQGFSEVTQENAQAAADVCSNVSRTVYDFVDYAWKSAKSTTFH